VVNLLRCCAKCENVLTAPKSYTNRGFPENLEMRGQPESSRHASPSRLNRGNGYCSYTEQNALCLSKQCSRRYIPSPNQTRSC
jgi:hypothetical protein